MRITQRRLAYEASAVEAWMQGQIDQRQQDHG
jgi:predicted DNA-binding transcriptional regulator AlpA